ncbi:MAG: hypothetical protein OEW05_10515, partial [Candidatus Aminicenantes bacterium]|nr:hypothetical protein [Candidatus Aminicenantes bacterium]
MKSLKPAALVCCIVLLGLRTAANPAVPALEDLRAGKTFIPSAVTTTEEDREVLRLFQGLRLADVSDGIEKAGRRQQEKEIGLPPDLSVSNVSYAGVRSSSYGLKPFPPAGGWQKAAEAMGDYFPGSTPAAIWIVGEMRKPRATRLFFPSDGQTYPHIQFEDGDKHEPFLTHFDGAGVKIFLQVEPADADVPTLIDLVLDRYKHHECVVGLGVDVEWYREADRPGRGIPVDDETAKIWEERVKSHNSSYRLFLKHWDQAWLPKIYRGDIVFVDDSQIFDNFEAMVEEFAARWAP